MWPFTKNEPGFWNVRYTPLAAYNSEVARGIIHTEKWQEKMKKLQTEYNKEMRVFYKAKGYIVV